MDVYKAMIVEDDYRIRHALKHMLEKKFPEIKIEAEADSVSKATNVLMEFTPDILFLDVCLGSNFGFELATQLQTKHTQVIVITADEGYAYQAFKIDAVDFILKPVTNIALSHAIEKAKNALALQNKEAEPPSDSLEIMDASMVALRSAEAIYFVHFDEILYCFSEKGYTTFFLKNERQIMISKTLKEVEAILPSMPFFRIHKSYLINCNYMMAFFKNQKLFVELINGTKIPVAQRKRAVFSQFIEGFRSI